MIISILVFRFGNVSAACVHTYCHNWVAAAALMLCRTACHHVDS